MEVFLQYIYPVGTALCDHHDITERRRTAENLAHAEERARLLLLESAGEGIYGLISKVVPHLLIPQPLGYELRTDRFDW